MNEMSHVTPLDLNVAADMLRAVKQQLAKQDEVVKGLNIALRQARDIQEDLREQLACAQHRVLISV